MAGEMKVNPWWRKFIIHSGVLLLLWSLVVLYSVQSGDYTVQGLMLFCSFWFITIWALSIMREGNSNSIIFFPRLLFLPFVLFMFAFAHWYSGETYLDIFIIVIMVSFWFIPFLFNLSKKPWLKILLLLIAVLITFTGSIIIPTISGVERLRSGNKRLLRYSYIVIKGQDFSVSEMGVLSGSKSVLRLVISSMENTEGLFDVISTISRLEKLVLRNMKIVGKETEHLAALARLKTILFEDVTLVDNDLENIRNCEHLETLTLVNTAVSCSDILEITQIRSLKNLELIGQVVPRDRIHEINNLKNAIEGLNITIIGEEQKE